MCVSFVFTLIHFLSYYEYYVTFASVGFYFAP